MTWFSWFLSPLLFPNSRFKVVFLAHLRFKIISIYTLLPYLIFKSSHFQIAISSLTSIQLLLRHNHSAAANHHIITFSNYNIFKLPYHLWLRYNCSCVTITQPPRTITSLHFQIVLFIFSIFFFLVRSSEFQWSLKFVSRPRFFLLLDTILFSLSLQ